MQVETSMEGENEMVVKRLSVPLGLEELMESLTKEVLRKKPADVYAFASEHFAQLLALRDTGCYKTSFMKVKKTSSAKNLDETEIIKQTSIKIKSAMMGSTTKIPGFVGVKSPAPTSFIRTNRKNVQSKQDGNMSPMSKSIVLDSPSLRSDRTRQILDKHMAKKQSAGDKSKVDNGKDPKGKPTKVDTSKKYGNKKATSQKDANYTENKKTGSSSKTKEIKSKSGEKKTQTINDETPNKSQFVANEGLKGNNTETPNRNKEFDNLTETALLETNNASNEKLKNTNSEKEIAISDTGSSINNSHVEIESKSENVSVSKEQHLDGTNQSKTEETNKFIQQKEEKNLAAERKLTKEKTKSETDSQTPNANLDTELASEYMEDNTDVLTNETAEIKNNLKQDKHGEIEQIESNVDDESNTAKLITEYKLSKEINEDKEENASTRTGIQNEEVNAVPDTKQKCESIESKTNEAGQIENDLKLNTDEDTAKNISEEIPNEREQEVNITAVNLDDNISGERIANAAENGNDRLQNAAVKIQASFKGYQTRKKLQEKADPKTTDLAEKEDFQENKNKDSSVTETDNKVKVNNESESLMQQESISMPEDTVVEEFNVKTVAQSEVAPKASDTSEKDSKSSDTDDIDTKEEDARTESKEETITESNMHEEFDNRENRKYSLLEMEEVLTKEQEESESNIAGEQEKNLEKVEGSDTNAKPVNENGELYKNSAHCQAEKPEDLSDKSANAAVQIQAYVRGHLARQKSIYRHNSDNITKSNSGNDENNNDEKKLLVLPPEESCSTSPETTENFRKTFVETISESDHNETQPTIENFNQTKTKELTKAFIEYEQQNYVTHKTVHLNTDEETQLIERVPKDDESESLTERPSLPELPKQETTALEMNLDQIAENNEHNKSSTFDHSVKVDSTRIEKLAYEPHNVEDAVIKIQSLWRGHMIRRHINRLELKDLQKPTECDELLDDRLSVKDLAKAATVIQALFRGYSVRKQFGIGKMEKNFQQETSFGTKLPTVLEAVDDIYHQDALKLETITNKDSVEDSNSNKDQKKENLSQNDSEEILKIKAKCGENDVKEEIKKLDIEEVLKNLKQLEDFPVPPKSPEISHDSSIETLQRSATIKEAKPIPSLETNLSISDLHTKNKLIICEEDSKTKKTDAEVNKTLKIKDIPDIHDDIAEITNSIKQDVVKLKQVLGDDTTTKIANRSATEDDIKLLELANSIKEDAHKLQESLTSKSVKPLEKAIPNEESADFEILSRPVSKESNTSADSVDTVIFNDQKTRKQPIRTDTVAIDNYIQDNLETSMQNLSLDQFDDDQDYGSFGPIQNKPVVNVEDDVIPQHIHSEGSPTKHEIKCRVLGELKEDSRENDTSSSGEREKRLNEVKEQSSDLVTDIIDSAAKKIQRFFKQSRGKGKRKPVNTMDQTAEVLKQKDSVETQSTLSSSEDKSSEAEREEILKQADSVQSSSTKNKSNDKDAAATTIQKTYRGYRARRDLQSRNTLTGDDAQYDKKEKDIDREITNLLKSITEPVRRAFSADKDKVESKETGERKQDSNEPNYVYIPLRDYSSEEQADFQELVPNKSRAGSKVDIYMPHFTSGFESGEVDGDTSVSSTNVDNSTSESHSEGTSISKNVPTSEYSAEDISDTCKSIENKMEFEQKDVGKVESGKEKEVQQYQPDNVATKGTLERNEVKDYKEKSESNTREQKKTKEKEEEIEEEHQKIDPEKLYDENLEKIIGKEQVIDIGDTKDTKNPAELDKTYQDTDEKQTNEEIANAAITQYINSLIEPIKQAFSADKNKIEREKDKIQDEGPIYIPLKDYSDENLEQPRNYALEFRNDKKESEILDNGSCFDSKTASDEPNQNTVEESNQITQSLDDTRQRSFNNSSNVSQSEAKAEERDQMKEGFKATNNLNDIEAEILDELGLTEGGQMSESNFEKQTKHFEHQESDKYPKNVSQPETTSNETKNLEAKVEDVRTSPEDTETENDNKGGNTSRSILSGKELHDSERNEISGLSELQDKFDNDNAQTQTQKTQHFHNQASDKLLKNTDQPVSIFDETKNLESKAEAIRTSLKDIERENDNKEEKIPKNVVSGKEVNDTEKNEKLKSMSEFQDKFDEKGRKSLIQDMKSKESTVKKETKDFDLLIHTATNIESIENTTIDLINDESLNHIGQNEKLPKIKTEIPLSAAMSSPSQGQDFGENNTQRNKDDKEERTCIVDASQEENETESLKDKNTDLAIKDTVEKVHINEKYENERIEAQKSEENLAFANIAHGSDIDRKRTSDASNNENIQDLNKENEKDEKKKDINMVSELNSEYKIEKFEETKNPRLVEIPSKIYKTDSQYSEIDENFTGGPLGKNEHKANLKSMEEGFDIHFVKENSTERVQKERNENIDHDDSLKEKEMEVTGLDKTQSTEEKNVNKTQMALTPVIEDTIKPISENCLKLKEDTFERNQDVAKNGEMLLKTDISDNNELESKILPIITNHDPEREIANVLNKFQKNEDAARENNSNVASHITDENQMKVTNSQKLGQSIEKENKIEDSAIISIANIKSQENDQYHLENADEKEQGLNTESLKTTINGSTVTDSRKQIHNNLDENFITNDIIQGEDGLKNPNYQMLDKANSDQLHPDVGTKLTKSEKGFSGEALKLETVVTKTSEEKLAEMDISNQELKNTEKGADLLQEIIIPSTKIDNINITGKQEKNLDDQIDVKGDTTNKTENVEVNLINKDDDNVDIGNAEMKTMQSICKENAEQQNYETGRLLPTAVITEDVQANENIKSTHKDSQQDKIEKCKKDTAIATTEKKESLDAEINVKDHKVGHGDENIENTTLNNLSHATSIKQNENLRDQCGKDLKDEHTGETTENTIKMSDAISMKQNEIDKDQRDKNLNGEHFQDNITEVSDAAALTQNENVKYQSDKNLNNEHVEETLENTIEISDAPSIRQNENVKNQSDKDLKDVYTEETTENVIKMPDAISTKQKDIDKDQNDKNLSSEPVQDNITDKNRKGEHVEETLENAIEMSNATTMNQNAEGQIDQDYESEHEISDSTSINLKENISDRNDKDLKGEHVKENVENITAMCNNISLQQNENVKNFKNSHNEENATKISENTSIKQNENIKDKNNDELKHSEEFTANTTEICNATPTKQKKIDKNHIETDEEEKIISNFEKNRDANENLEREYLVTQLTTKEFHQRESNDHLLQTVTMQSTDEVTGGKENEKNKSETVKDSHSIDLERSNETFEQKNGEVLINEENQPVADNVNRQTITENPAQVKTSLENTDAISKVSDAGILNTAVSEGTSNVSALELKKDETASSLNVIDAITSEYTRSEISVASTKSNGGKLHTEKLSTKENITNTEKGKQQTESGSQGSIRETCLETSKGEKCAKDGYTDMANVDELDATIKKASDTFGDLETISEISRNEPDIERKKENDVTEAIRKTETIPTESKFSEIHIEEKNQKGKQEVVAVDQLNVVTGENFPGGTVQKSTPTESSKIAARTKENIAYVDISDAKINAGEGTNDGKELIEISKTDTAIETNKEEPPSFPKDTSVTAKFSEENTPDVSTKFKENDLQIDELLKGKMSEGDMRNHSATDYIPEFPIAQVIAFPNTEEVTEETEDSTNVDSLDAGNKFDAAQITKSKSTDVDTPFQKEPLLTSMSNAKTVSSDFGPESILEIDANEKSPPFYLHQESYRKSPTTSQEKAFAEALKNASNDIVKDKTEDGERLLHSSEFHDSIPLNIPSEKTADATAHSMAGPPFLVHSGELHDNIIPLVLQMNDAPAGTETMTSGRKASVSVDAQASDKDVSATCEDAPDITPRSKASFDMDTEKRNNSAIVRKSTEVEAATKIQASFRGYQVRKQLKNRNTGGVISNNRRSSRRKSSGRISEAKRSAIQNQKPSQLEEQSATKIQAGIRGFLVRRRQKKEKKTKTPESG